MLGPLRSTNHLQITWICLALACLCLRPADLRAQNLADIIERCEKSLVRIEVKSPDGDSLGSGYVIDNATIATNVHVLAGATSAKAIFPDQKTFTVVGTLYLDPKRDIAIARIDGVGVDQLPTLQFSNTPVRKGDRVTALGSPLGLSFSATTGVVSAIRTAQELGEELGDKELEGTWIQVDAALSPGNSGGPIINDTGDVVAMSTLASQGAQNLNFGISASDVNTARQMSSGKNVVSFSEGVGRIRGKESRKRGEPGIVEPKEVPKNVIESYVASGRSEFKTILRDLTREIERLKVDLKQMKSGETFIPPMASSRNVDVARIPNPARKGVTAWYFRSEAVKRREIADTEARLRDLNKIKEQTGSFASGDQVSKDALLTLLSKYGMRLDSRAKGTVGFMSEAIVLHSYNDHDVLVIYDDTPCLLYLESTAGLFLGQEVTPQPVYVAGTATAQIEDGATASLTVLQSLDKDDLHSVIFGTSASSTTGGSNNVASNSPSSVPGPSSSQNNPPQTAARPPMASGSRVGRDGLYAPPSPSGARTWFDRSGRFSVEAVLLSKSNDEVVLRKLDGKVIRVPRANLCDADQLYLKQ